jgi:hypothetical protein
MKSIRSNASKRMKLNLINYCITLQGFSIWRVWSKRVMLFYPRKVYNQNYMLNIPGLISRNYVGLSQKKYFIKELNMGSYKAIVEVEAMN